MLFSFYKEGINLEFSTASMLQLWIIGIKMLSNVFFFQVYLEMFSKFILGRKLMASGSMRHHPGTQSCLCRRFQKHEKLSWGIEMFMPQVADRTKLPESYVALSTTYLFYYNIYKNNGNMLCVRQYSVHEIFMYPFYLEIVCVRFYFLHQ